jgi:predicted nucleotidyltransferase
MEKNAILDAVFSVDKKAAVWLFGSRTDDTKKGGDIDIAILSKKAEIEDKIAIKQRIFDKIGEQKMDVVISPDRTDPFFNFALETGQLLAKAKRLSRPARKMENSANNILKANLNSLSLSLKRLLDSYERCVRIGIKETYSDEEFEKFDVLTSRYARTTDLLISKVLRSLDVVEFIDGGTIIDTVNRAEKRGIVNSVSQLRALKDLRNEISHEYQSENIGRFFKSVTESVPVLREIIEKLIVYCGKLPL